MTIEELINELEFHDPNAVAEVEINGIVYPIELVTEDSQGVYLIATTEYNK